MAANPNPPRPSIPVAKAARSVVPTPTTIRNRQPLPPVSIGRPSQNLAHPLGSQVLKPLPTLASHIRASNPLAFTPIPKVVRHPTSVNYGQRVKAAIQALQRPTHAQPGSGQRPITNWGTRVTAAIRSVSRG
jgi:hypothetical protein